MTDDEKLDKAFNHIKRNGAVRRKFIAAAENNEWELVGQIVIDVLHLLGYAISAFFDLADAVVEWFRDLF